MNATTTDAFVHGLRVGCVVAAGVALAGAVAAVALLPSRPPAAAAPGQLTLPAGDRTLPAGDRTLPAGDRSGVDPDETLGVRPRGGPRR